LTRTSFGLAIRAVAYNKDVAYLMGVNVPFAVSAIFGIGCGLAAGAGVLIAPLNYVSLLMGFKIMLKVFSAAVVGGLGSFRGAIAGGLLVGLAESLGAGYVSASLKDVYAFFLMMLVLMIRPAGIFGVDVRIKA
jgi:branched-chain amino acid transport system permease protein